MTVKAKAFWIGGATLVVVRALLWLLSFLGFSSASRGSWDAAFMVAAIVALFVVLDEIDGMRRTYARELWKVRIEANREAVEWLRNSDGLESNLEAALDGWNKELHAVVPASTTQKAMAALEDRVASAALKDE